MPQTYTVHSLDINGKPIDWNEAKLPKELAKQVIDMIERGA